MNIVKILLPIFVVFLFNACREDSDSKNPSRLKVVVAISDSKQYDILLNGISIAHNIKDGQSTDYFSVDPGHSELSIIEIKNNNPVFQKTIFINEEEDQTLLVTGDSNALSAKLVSDDSSEPKKDRFRFRIINLTSNFGSIDVFITKKGEDISGSPDITSLATGEVSKYFSMDTDEKYEIHITRSDSFQELIRPKTINLSEGDVGTVYVTTEDNTQNECRIIVVRDENYD